MDPTNRRHPKSSSSAAATHTTAYDVRTHFSNLSTATSASSNRKAASSRAPNPDVKDVNLQAKALAKSAMLSNYSKTAAPLFPKSKSLKEAQIVGSKSVNKEKAGKEVDKRVAINVVKKEVAKSLKRGESIYGVKSLDLNEKVKNDCPKMRVCGGLIEQPAVRSAVSNSGGGGGLRGRRSLSDVAAEVELSDFLVKNGVKVMSADMSPYMQIHAVGLARKTCDSLEKFTSKTLALTLKKEFDGMYGPAWHCIVGTSFGSFVTHSVGGFMYFSMDHKHYILLFKTSVQRV